MEHSVDLHNIEKGLLELFQYAFTTNCLLDDESVTREESKTLAELDPSETLENFKDLVLALLEFKKKFKTSDTAELARRAEQFENLLQKVEAEVRTHIRVEHQLKLHIETTQQRIDDLEKIESNDKVLIKELEGKCRKSARNGESEKVRRELDEKVKGLTEVLDKKDKSIGKLEAENLKLRNLLEEKIRELESVKKEAARMGKVGSKALNAFSAVERTKKFGDSKNFQQSLRERGSSNENRSEKRLADTENSKMSISPYLKREVIGGRKEERGARNCLGKTHVRSNSEQKILTWKRF